jgi:D-serine dehydratase
MLTIASCQWIDQARGGLYEVLKFAEEIDLKSRGMISSDRIIPFFAKNVSGGCFQILICTGLYRGISD